MRQTSLQSGRVAVIPKETVRLDPTQRLHPRALRIFLAALITLLAVAISGLFNDVGAQAPIANDDEFIGFPAGVRLTLDVLRNDVGGAGSSAIDPTSVQLINPDTMELTTVWDEVGEGRWEVDTSTGHIIFTGCKGIDDPFDGCTGNFEGATFPIEYIVRNQAGAASNPAQIYVSLTKTGGTVSVTIGYFLAERSGQTVRFHWQTATESGNAGFNLLGESVEDGLVKINPELIASKVIDSVEPVEYEYSRRTSSNIFYIEEVKLDGTSDRFGPLEIGTVYGEYVPLAGDRPTQAYLPLINKP